MPRFVEIAGCPCPVELAPFVREVMRRTGVAPVTIYRGDEPQALRILHANDKHSQAELVQAYKEGRAAEYKINGQPNAPGFSTHELFNDGTAFSTLPRGAKLDPMQCGMDWPIHAVPAVIREFEKLGCEPFRPYGAASTEAQHICCRAEGGRLSILRRLASDPIEPGDRSEAVRTVQVYLVRARLLPQDFDVAERVGTYGPRMVTAVKEFQRRHRLEVDGIVGPKTFAALRRRFGRRGSVMRARAARRARSSAAGGDGALAARAARRAGARRAGARRAAALDGRPGRMRLSPQGLAFIKRFEGFRATPYNDGRGVMTIGYGETRQPLPRRLTEPQAARLLAKRLDEAYEPAVRALFGPGGLPFNQHRYDALVSFAYNLGPGSVQGVRGFETIGRAIRAGDLSGIARAMPLYSNPSDPVVHRGLLRRRKAEAAMFRRRPTG